MRIMFLIFGMLVGTGLFLYADKHADDGATVYRQFTSNCKAGTIRWQIVRNDYDVIFSASCSPRH